MITYITPQLHPVTQLPVVSTCIAVVACLALMYVIGHLEGWNDCIAQSEPWAARQARNQELNMRRSETIVRAPEALSSARTDHADIRVTMGRYVVSGKTGR